MSLGTGPLTRQLPLPVELRTEADFSEYLPGPNAEAVAAIRGWSTGSGDPFLYLFGESATGKTHLLQAACRAARARPVSAFYLPLSHEQLTPRALDELERAELVAIDDLHAVVGDEGWEHALFDLYNRLRDAGRRLLVSASASAAELPIDLADLHSRLTWGPCYHLQMLSDTDCEHLLLRSAERRGLPLTSGAVRYIMRRCPRDPRHLLTFLEALDQTALSRKRRATLPLIRELLQAPAGWAGSK